MPSTLQWCRCGRFRGRNLAESVAARRRFRAGVGVFWQTLVTSVVTVDRCTYSVIVRVSYCQLSVVRVNRIGQTTIPGAASNRCTRVQWSSSERFADFCRSIAWPVEAETQRPIAGNPTIGELGAITYGPGPGEQFSAQLQLSGFAAFQGRFQFTPSSAQRIAQGPRVGAALRVLALITDPRGESPPFSKTPTLAPHAPRPSRQLDCARAPHSGPWRRRRCQKRARASCRRISPPPAVLSGAAPISCQPPTIPRAPPTTIHPSRLACRGTLPARREDDRRDR